MKTTWAEVRSAVRAVHKSLDEFAALLAAKDSLPENPFSEIFEKFAKEKP